MELEIDPSVLPRPSELEIGFNLEARKIRNAQLQANSGDHSQA